MAILFFHDRQTRHTTSPELKHTDYKFSVHYSDPIDADTVWVVPIKLKISGHEPCTYFDIAVFPYCNHKLIIVATIAINMAPPTREQFMAGVNSTGPDGRSLPAGAAAAARMTAAEQEALRKADEETYATSSAAIRKVEREKEKLAKKEEKGDQKSLLRRVGSKIASAFKREQEKMN
jgi:hypothetical protein